jgi:hypothetical protein
MNGPEYGEYGGEDYRHEPAMGREPGPASPNEAEGDSPQGANVPVTSFDLLRRVIVGVIQSVSDGAELISTSVAEEFIRFRVDVEHRVIVILLFIAGILAVGVGLMLFLRQLIGTWPPTLLIIGGCFLGVGIFLSRRWCPKGD